MPVYSLDLVATSPIMDANSAAAPVTGDTFAIPGHATMINWGISFAAAPSAVTVRLEGSLDGVNWSLLDQSTATAGEMKKVDFGWIPAFIRAVKQSQTGGGALTVLVRLEMA